jgi:hypothetical protein
MTAPGPVPLNFGEYDNRAIRRLTRLAPGSLRVLEIEETDRPAETLIPECREH